MTERLYFTDATLRAFTAQVTATRLLDGQPAVALDRTAFYPTGGGQPHDTGVLNSSAVLDVRSDAGEVWHLLAAPLAVGAVVQGELNWPRRRDHMQNHTGQHILTGAFLATAHAATVAWHLSEGSVTIDLDQASLSDSQLADAEQLANAIVEQDLPVQARFISLDELPSLHLRKQPDVDGPLRIVEIGDFDRVACGGTHVPSTAHVGLIKLLRTERRGVETRVHFACGQRARADYTAKHQLTRDLAARLTCGLEELPQAIERLQQQASTHFKALRSVQAELVTAEAKRLAVAAPDKRIVAEYPAWEGEQLKQLALTLRDDPALTVALAGAGNQVLLARGVAATLDCGQALRSVLAAVGGRGGGRPDFAQGAAPTWEATQQALHLLAVQL